MLLFTLTGNVHFLDLCFFCSIQFVHSVFLSFHACTTEDKTFSTAHQRSLFHSKRNINMDLVHHFPVQISLKRNMSPHTQWHRQQRNYIHLKVKYFFNTLKKKWIINLRAISLQPLATWFTALGVRVLRESKLCREVCWSLRITHHRETCVGILSKTKIRIRWI